MDAKRVLVYSYEGKFKRGWGGHGMPLSDVDNNPTPPYDTSDITAHPVTRMIGALPSVVAD